MSVLEDILQEVLDMDAEQRKNLLEHMRAGQCLDPITPIARDIDISQIDYIKGLSEKARELFKFSLDNFDLNLYHSAAAIINNGYGHSLQQKYNEYIKKYSVKRPWMKGKEEQIKEIFIYVCKRLKRFDLLKK